MSDGAFRVLRLGSDRDRSAFACDSEPLIRYFREVVGQDVRRRVAACFVAVTDDNTVAGYYTLASARVPLVDLPPEITKKLPRYPAVPAVRTGRLAVDRRFEGMGLGGALLSTNTTRSSRCQAPRCRCSFLWPRRQSLRSGSRRGVRARCHAASA